MSKIAAILGENEDSEYYKKLNKNICRAYIKLLTDGKGNIDDEHQTEYVLPLYFNMAEGEIKKTMAKNLNRLVVENAYHLATGFPGTPYILFALADNGYKDTAYRVLLQETCPSWLYAIKMGGTTFWEQWNAITPEGEVRDPSMNHYAYGAVGDFLYRRLLGIEPLEGGYKKFKVQPIIGGDINFARGKVNTPYGQISVDWQIHDNTFNIDVIVPPSTKCELITTDKKKHELTCGCFHFECSYNQ